MTDDQVIARAHEILQERERHQHQQLESWYAQYARGREKQPHHLGKGKLTHGEAVLLVALENNGYRVEGDAPNAAAGGRWHGSAECRWHVRDYVISQYCDDRLSLLWSLWAGVSDQAGMVVQLTEEDLQGELRRRQTQQLLREVQDG